MKAIPCKPFSHHSVAWSAISALALAIVLSQAGKADAMSFYLNARTGNDSQTGQTPQQAWRSLEKLKGLKLAPGDRIVLASGDTFTGAIELSAEDAGTPENPIVICSEGEGRVTIVSPDRPALSLAAGGIEVRDLVLKGEASKEKKGHAGITLLAGGKPGERHRHIRLENIEISGFGGDGINLGSQDEALSGFDDVLFSHVNAHENFGTGLITYDKVGDRTKGYAHHNVVIRDCDFSRNHSGSGLILSGIDGALAEYCRADSNSGAGGGVGIWAYAAKGIRFRYCIASGTRSHGKDGGGFDLDGACVDCVVENCLAYENDGPGYMHCDYPTSGKTQGNIIRASISLNDGRKKEEADAVGFGFVTWGDGLDDCRISDNLAIVTKDSAHNPTGGVLFVAYIPGSVKPGEGRLHIRNCIATNNRVYLSGMGPSLVSSDLPGATANDVRFADNTYRTQGSATPLFVWNDRKFSSRDEWQQATGQEISEHPADKEKGELSLPMAAADSVPKDPRALPDYPLMKWLNTINARSRQ